MSAFAYLEIPFKQENQSVSYSLLFESDMGMLDNKLGNLISRRIVVRINNSSGQKLSTPETYLRSKDTRVSSSHTLKVLRVGS